MESATMGRVLTEATVENLKDLWAVEQGLQTADQARRVTIPDALVDTGATMLSLPTSMIRRLGLVKTADKNVLSSAGPKVAALYDVVRLTIQGRSCPVSVLEVPDGVAALIGQIPLEYLDFVVDPQSRRLIGNPAHGGEQVYELY
jgi:predicted aspartyl protease